MLSSAALEQNAENRRSEKTLFTMQQLELKITKSIYQDLISWLVETCDSLGLQPTTRYLSRAYFDEVVRCGQKGQVSWWAAVAVTCISVAIKFNEVRQVADRYAPEYLLRFTESDISGDQYFVLEIKVLTVLRMRFKLTTPYDYFPYFFARFPWLQCTREAINDLLHLAVALPNTYSYSAEELFYACVRAIFLYKAVQLTELQISVFSSMTDSWGKSKGLSLEILGVIQSFMEPSPNN